MLFQHLLMVKLRRKYVVWNSFSAAITINKGELFGPEKKLGQSN